MTLRTVAHRARAAIRQVLGRPGEPDYRAELFDELRRYLDGTRPRRVLEIGPKDGQDTRRLLGLDPDLLVLIDLPRLREANERWLRQIASSRVQYVSANFMYSDVVDGWDPFDCIWCTGVIYQNPEQLRMVKKLFDLLRPGGVLVLESATIRRWWLRRANCVEILYPPSPREHKKYHLSRNITHLPSQRAVASWLAMIGFERILRSRCHRRVSAALARDRVAYLATKPMVPPRGTYYDMDGEDGFIIGASR